MKNKPDRHPNRLSRFDYSQNGGYFLTLCAKDRQPLFGHFPNACVGGGVLDAPYEFCGKRAGQPDRAGLRFHLQAADQSAGERLFVAARLS